MEGVSILFFIFSLVSVFTAELPNWIHKCKFSNFEKCGPPAANAVWRKLSKGDIKLGVPTFYPLQIGDIDIQEQDVKITLKKCELYGLDSLYVYRTKWEEPTFNFGFALDTLTILGQFSEGSRVNGAILPRNGIANFTIKDAKIEMEVLNSITEKSSKLYVTPHQAYTKIYTRTSLCTFSGFRTGIPYLSIENSKSFTNSILATFESALFEAYKQSLGQILKRISLDDLFVREK